MNKFVGFIGKILIGLVIILTIVAYFFTSYDSNTNIWYDGLGRQMYELPNFLRFFIGPENHWPGLFWFVVDLVVFWGGIIIGFHLIGLESEKDNKSKAYKD